MGLKRVTKKFLKYLIPIFLVLLVIPFTDRRSHKRKDNPFGSDKVRCMIALGDYDRLSRGFLAGYHYEMLKAFVGSIGDTALINIGREDACYTDSVLADRLDILVIPGNEYSEVAGLHAWSLGDTDIVWVMKDSPSLNSEYAHWLIDFNGSSLQASTHERFFNGFNPYRKGTGRNREIISPYDAILKKNAEKLGWDWKMLAAMVWAESKFRIDTRSPRGATGVMQVMPSTARSFGVDDLWDPEENIKAGTALLGRLQRLYSDVAADRDELTKITLAAYNAGPGRISDCIRMARSQGIDPSTWSNLCSVIPMMSQEADSLLQQDVLYGPFKGAETIAYVKAVLNQYDIFRGLPPRYRMPADTLEAAGEDFPDEDFVEILMTTADTLLRDSLHRDTLGTGLGRERHEKEVPPEHSTVPGQSGKGLSWR
ncbi:MAG: transglycosylase SLT domain-containing protein [Candidatus Cryptobacteroides sp.]